MSPLQVISGSFLTEKRTNCLVEAEMYGLPADTVRHKYTKKAAAPHPFWNEEPFTFKRVYTCVACVWGRGGRMGVFELQWNPSIRTPLK